MLDAVKTVPVGAEVPVVHRLETCLITPATKIDELSSKYPDKQEYRKQVVKFWLETSAYASWEDLGRELLLYGHQKALHEVKCYITPHSGGSKLESYFVLRKRHQN